MTSRHKEYTLKQTDRVEMFHKVLHMSVIAIEGFGNSDTAPAQTAVTSDLSSACPVVRGG